MFTSTFTQLLSSEVSLAVSVDVKYNVSITSTSELWSCVKVEVAILGSHVDVKQH